MPIIIGVLALVVIVLGVVAWKIFAPPPDPMAGMTDAEKVEAIKKATKNIPQREGGMTPSHRLPVAP